jgi:glutathione S-transferase
VHIELGPSKPAWYAQKVNQFGTVPALFDNGHPVFESLIVAEYFQEKYATAETSILPTDPLERATIRLLVARWGDKCVRPLYSLLSNTDLSKADELEDAARAYVVMKLRCKLLSYTAPHRTMFVR